MEAAIRAVQRGENALLESPTGTGKTLCLLCSSLAWLENEKRRGGSAPQPALSGSIPPKKEHGESAESVARALVDKNSTEARISMPSRRVPTIFYASRTHSQLSQVVKEVRSSAYAHSTTVAVLGSRQQLCVHEQVSNLPTNSAINHACNELTQTRPARCHFRNAVPDNGSLGLAPSSVSSSSTYSQNSAPSSLRPSSASSLGGWGAARDIEELVELGKQDAVCPYFLSRNVVPEANLVLLPYNYLLDPPTRESLKVNWSNSIIIFDEAHNLESIASDAASCELSSYDLAGAMAEVDRCIEIAQRLGCEFAEDGVPSAVATTGPTVDNLLIVKQVLVGIDHELDAVSLPDPSNSSYSSRRKGVSRNGTWLVEMLEKHNVTSSTVEPLLGEISKALDLLMDENALGGPSVSLRLEAVVKLLRSVFRRNQSEAICQDSMSNAAEIAERYRCHIAPLEPKRGKVRKGDGYSKSRDSYPPGSSGSRSGTVDSKVLKGVDSISNGPRLLSFWCFCPGIAMEELKQLGVRSVLLASGTLAPLASFAAELMLPFPNRLENPHVIDTTRQVLAGVVAKGVTGHSLNSSYQNRETSSYKIELGRTLSNFARVVPGGLLVFFPSYAALESAVEFWRGGDSSSNGSNGGNAIWNALDSAKGGLFVEPRTSSELKQTIKNYEDRIRQDPARGAILLAVCRGKVSEGLDFADAKARAVVITGIPYAPAMDAKILLKKEQLDQQLRMSKQIQKQLKQRRDRDLDPSECIQSDLAALEQLSGDEWYSQQALRAVNQALGRVIRHRSDWGAVLLCDERFAAPKHMQCLSSWIRPHIEIFGLASKGSSVAKNRSASTGLGYRAYLTMNNQSLGALGSSSNLSSAAAAASGGSIGELMKRLHTFTRTAASDPLLQEHLPRHTRIRSEQSYEQHLLRKGQIKCVHKGGQWITVAFEVTGDALLDAGFPEKYLLNGRNEQAVAKVPQSMIMSTQDLTVGAFVEVNWNNRNIQGPLDDMEADEEFNLIVEKSKRSRKFPAFGSYIDSSHSNLSANLTSVTGETDRRSSLEKWKEQRETKKKQQQQERNATTAHDASRSAGPPSASSVLFSVLSKNQKSQQPSFSAPDHFGAEGIELEKQYVLSTESVAGEVLSGSSITRLWQKSQARKGKLHGLGAAAISKKLPQSPSPEEESIATQPASRPITNRVLGLKTANKLTNHKISSNRNLMQPGSISQLIQKQKERNEMLPEKQSLTQSSRNSAGVVHSLNTATEQSRKKLRPLDVPFSSSANSLSNLSASSTSSSSSILKKRGRMQVQRDNSQTSNEQIRNTSSSSSKNSTANSSIPSSSSETKGSATGRFSRGARMLAHLQNSETRTRKRFSEQIRSLDELEHDDGGGIAQAKKAHKDLQQQSLSKASRTQAAVSCMICLRDPGIDDDGDDDSESDGESTEHVPLRAKCGHVACKGCWGQWRKSEKNQKQCTALMQEPGGPSDCPMVCPACRAPVFRYTLKAVTVTIVASAVK